MSEADSRRPIRADEEGGRAEDRLRALEARIEEGVRARAQEAPPLALRRTDSLEPELRALAGAIADLRRRIAGFGEVTTTRSGVAARIELAVKAGLRKLVQRHIDQEKEVHEALERVLDRLSSVLAAEHALLDENATVLSDASVRRERRDEEG